MSLPDQEYLHECFNYNPDTGCLIWKKRPDYHFENEHAKMCINNRHAGKLAGSIPTKSSQSHVRIKGRYYSVKKIIWKLVTGEDPMWHLTFKDGNESNLIFSNIVPKTETPIYSTGYKWVTKVKNKFIATVTHDYTRHYIGSFDTAEKAYEASLRKRKELNNEI